MTNEDYYSLLAEQNGVCKICGSDDPLMKSSFSGERRFSIDHCHTTGVVRGLLCANCNNGLGRFKDNPEWLRNAARYLETGRTKFVGPKHCLSKGEKKKPPE
jgi:hypothetical protein